MDVILFFVACCPLSCISWTPAALCSLPLGNCCPALSHSQQEPLPAAPERWWLVTVAANFFSFTRSQPPFFHFGDSSPWFLAWLQQAPGETGEGAALRAQQLAVSGRERGSRKTWIPSSSSAWHLTWNFSSLLQFSSCSEEDMILNVSAMCSLPCGSFTCPYVRAALLFKTIAPNLRLFPNIPWLQYKYPEVCTLFWALRGFLSFRRKIRTVFQFCVHVEIMLLWGQNISTSNRSMLKMN